jgi:hypothetical protein
MGCPFYPTCCTAISRNCKSKPTSMNPVRPKSSIRFTCIRFGLLLLNVLDPLSSSMLG